jgi:hypothetical protein
VAGDKVFQSNGYSYGFEVDVTSLLVRLNGEIFLVWVAIATLSGEMGRVTFDMVCCRLVVWQDVEDHNLFYQLSSDR